MAEQSTTFKSAFDRTNKELVLAALSGDPSWNSRVPAISKADWNEIGVSIASDAYTPMRNSVFDALVNRIGETIMQVQDFANPLSLFKRGTMLYGDTVQEMAVDVIDEQRYVSGTETKIGEEPDQFARAPGKVIAAYSRINREAQFPMTIDDPRLRQAFIEPRGLFNLLDEEVSMMEKSNRVNEFVYTKKLITQFAADNEAALQPGQVQIVGDITGDSTAEQVRQWLIKVKTALRGLTFPTRGTTKANIMTQSAPDDLVVILRYDIPIINEVSNLATAFNPEFMDMRVPILSVDSFSDDRTSPNDIIGVIVDRRAIEIREIYRGMSTADNARALYRNYFLTIRQLYRASALKPFLFLCKDGSGIKVINASGKACPPLETGKK